MVVFKMLHTLIHFVALTKPSNLLLRGKRGITRFCPAKEGELYHSYWQWGKYEGDKFLMPSFTCSCFFFSSSKGGPRCQLPGYIIIHCCLRKTKTFAKLLSGEKKFDQILLLCRPPASIGS